MQWVSWLLGQKSYSRKVTEQCSQALRSGFRMVLCEAGSWILMDPFQIGVLYDSEMLRCVVLATHWNRLKVSVLTFWTSWVGTWPGFQLGLEVQLAFGMCQQMSILVPPTKAKVVEEGNKLSQGRQAEKQTLCQVGLMRCPELRKRHFSITPDIPQR